MHLAMGVPLRVATATSNLMIGITAAASAVIYLLRGEIDPYVAGPTAIGVFLGATLGSRVAHRIGLRYLRWLFVVVLALHRASRCCCGPSRDARPGRPPPRPRVRPVHRPAADRRHVRRGRAADRGRRPAPGGGISPLAGGPPLDPGPPRRRTSRPLAPAAFLWLGILAVIATPLSRVVAAAVGFARLRRSAGWSASPSRSSAVIARRVAIAVGSCRGLTGELARAAAILGRLRRPATASRPSAQEPSRNDHRDPGRRFGPVAPPRSHARRHWTS